VANSGSAIERCLPAFARCCLSFVPYTLPSPGSPSIAETAVYVRLLRFAHQRTAPPR